MTPRDSQRSRVYAAEQAIRGSGGVLSPAETVALVRQIEGSAYWKRLVRGGDGPVRVVLVGRRTRTAVATAYRVDLSAPWAKTPDVVCHEMAHVLHKRLKRITDQTGHGWEFCSIYLELVRLFMGRKAHDTLLVSFRRNKVRYRKPAPKRTLTPAQRRAAADRLAAARAKRFGTLGRFGLAQRSRWHDGWEFVNLKGSGNFWMENYQIQASCWKSLDGARRNAVKVSMFGETALVDLDKCPSRIDADKNIPASAILERYDRRALVA